MLSVGGLLYGYTKSHQPGNRKSCDMEVFCTEESSYWFEKEQKAIHDCKILKSIQNQSLPRFLTNETKGKKVTDKTHLMNPRSSIINQMKKKYKIRKLQFQPFLLSFFPRYIILNFKFTGHVNNHAVSSDAILIEEV